MVEIVTKHTQVESESKPIHYDSSNVRFWEDLSKELMEDGKGKSYLTKARGFIDNECIVKISSAGWKIKPIEGYNKKTYEVNLTYKGFECSCQGFQKKELEFEQGRTDTKPLCSHIVAVRQFCFLEERKSI